MVSFNSCRKFFVLSALLCVLGGTVPSHAASNIDPACDPTFLDKMRERAWGEAQREMMTNRQMIWKPDSVLALGCYAYWISGLPISFSKSTSGLSTLTSNGSSYLSTAFGHTLGGGNLGGSNTSNCANISTLWNGSECMNLTLANLQSLNTASSSDPRVKPTACGSTGASWTATKATITTSGAGAPFDAMNLFTAIIGPLSELSSPGNCSVGIPTGVKLGGGSNPEVVCPNPGCSPSGGAHPKCCKSGSTTNCSAAL